MTTAFRFLAHIAGYNWQRSDLESGGSSFAARSALGWLGGQWSQKPAPAQPLVIVDCLEADRTENQAHMATFPLV